MKERFINAGENPFATWRKKHGLTRVELARLLNVPYSTIYKLEAGHFATPLPRRLEFKIVEASLPHELLAEYIRWRHGEPPKKQGLKPPDIQEGK